MKSDISIECSFIDTFQKYVDDINIFEQAATASKFYEPVTNCGWFKESCHFLLPRSCEGMRETEITGYLKDLGYE